MLFKTPELATELLAAHPELRRILNALDTEVQSLGMEQLVITHVKRTPEQQEDFYWRHYMQQFPAISEETARAKARRRFSWHLASCAGDFRNSGYTDEQRTLIRRWLTAKYTKPRYEILEHDVGRGDHFHVGVCDFLWRRKYEQRTGKNTGAA